MNMLVRNRMLIVCRLLDDPVIRLFRASRLRSGLSQVEVAVSTVIVGILMVASFSTIAASRRSQISESNKVRGIAVAEAMLAEITQLPMRDPSCDCGFGPGAEELGSNRNNFDDIDDYRNFIESPLRDKNGTVLDGYTNFTRTVSVDRVSTGDWNAIAATYSGVYRITVVVRVGTAEVCRLVSYRTSGSTGANSLAGFSSVN
jgi:type II secretory pathway pseudopilin PulG